MIRGKYLRERKAIRVKRRMKLLLALVILLLVHKIVFNSYSLYESEANSTADIDVAFYTLETDFATKVISLDEIIPGEERRIEFSIANYYVDDAGNNVTSETDMEYTLKIRTTTNLPLEYKLYKNQSLGVDNLTNILELDVESMPAKNMYLDDDNTIFKNLVQASLPDDEKANGITDMGEFLYTAPATNTYILEFKLDEKYDSVDYQNLIDCIEITVDSKQKIDEN